MSQIRVVAARGRRSSSLLVMQVHQARAFQLAIASFTMSSWSLVVWRPQPQRRPATPQNDSQGQASSAVNPHIRFEQRICPPTSLPRPYLQQEPPLSLVHSREENSHVSSSVPESRDADIGQLSSRNEPNEAETVATVDALFLEAQFPRRSLSPEPHSPARAHFGAHKRNATEAVSLHASPS